MKNQTEQTYEGAQDIRLSNAAKGRIRSALQAHMEAYPVQKGGIASPYTRFFGFLSPINSLRMPAFAAAFILILAVGGATSYAAEGALPGDALYPVKVGVIEPAQGLFAVSPEAKTDWNITLAETRLREAEQLSQDSRLTASDTEEIQTNLDSSLAEAHKNIETLSAKNPEAGARADAALTFSLGIHATVLEHLGVAASSSETEAVTLFANHVRSRASEGGSARTAAATTTSAHDKEHPVMLMKPRGGHINDSREATTTTKDGNNNGDEAPSPVPTPAPVLNVPTIVPPAVSIPSFSGSGSGGGSIGL